MVRCQAEIHVSPFREWNNILFNGVIAFVRFAANDFDFELILQLTAK